VIDRLLKLFGHGLTGNMLFRSLSMRVDFIIRSSRNFGTGGSQGSLESKLLDTFLDLCQQRGYLRARSRQRTDSTHVLGAVKVLNALELVGETVRHARSAAGNCRARMAETAGQARMV
jgi:hypothetical protein